MRFRRFLIEVEEYYGTMAAGILPIARTTGNMLITLRSAEVSDPHTWGPAGGKAKGEEGPEEAARREFGEETGYRGNFDIRDTHIYRSPSDAFQYHTFIGFIAEEFEPKLDFENDSHHWSSLEDLLSGQISPLHPNFQAMITSEASKIKQMIGQLQ